MRKFCAFLALSLILFLAADSYAQDSTNTAKGNMGTGTMDLKSNGTEKMQSQHQTSTTVPKSLQNNDQQDRTNVDDWSRGLADELKLNVSQRDSVKAILSDYQKQRNSLDKDMTDSELTSFNSTFNDRIVNILEGDQVNSYKSYNKSWWNNINSTISNSGRNNNSDKKQTY